MKLLAAFGLLNFLGVTLILFSSYMFLDVNIVDQSVMPRPSVTKMSHPRSNAKTNTTNNATTIQIVDGSHSRIIIPIHKVDGESIKTTKVTANNADSITTATSPSDNQRLHKDRKETFKQLLQLGLDHPTILDDIQSLPPWSSIVEQYGTQPIILGLETCAQYREQVPLEHRWVAAAGLFHTGTNLIADLLMGTCHFSSPQKSIFKFQVRKFTCIIPLLLYSIPSVITTLSDLCVCCYYILAWGKHNPTNARTSYTIPKPKYQGIDPSTVLPLVLTRHPIDWMPSVCRQPYAVSWNRTSTTTPCPDLGQPVRAKVYQTQEYASLLHYWNEWNGGYYYYSNTSTTFPRLMIRLEDLVYFPKPTLSTICDCVGGQFLWIPELLSHKRGGHVGKEGSNNSTQKQRHPLIQAWQRHANVRTTAHQMDRQDQTATREIMDFQLLNALGYRLWD
jgi:hypothetical protein